MKTVKNRIETLEKHSGITEEPLPPPVVRLPCDCDAKDEFYPADDEDVKDWLTYKNWLAEHDGETLLPPFFAYADKEAQARRNSQ